MKINLKILQLLIAVAIMCTNCVYGQFNTSGGIGDRWGQTNNPNPNNTIRRVGIGDFTNNPPASAFHINTNFLTPVSPFALNTFLPGEVFRTDAPGGVNTFWRLLRGGQEKGVLFNNFVNNDFQIQATQPTAKILLNTGGPTSGTVRERVRISQGLGFGGVTNVTRVGINYGATNTPIGVPRAILQLGDDFNIAGSIRNWVDVGTLSALNSDHVYFGLKDEGAIFSDRMDAVINWGNNVSTSFPNAFGPDNLRFIFTQRLNAGSGDPREEQNGLEIARMTPVGATTLSAPNFGMMGIGDFSPTGPNTAPADVVDAKLDIDGDLRVREVTQDNTLTQILAIDPTDHNRVHWVDAANFTGGGGVTANNGLSIDPLNPNNVQLGNDVGLTTAQLLNDREISMNDNNIYFTDNLSSTQFKNQIGIGVPSSTNLSGQLHVLADQINHDIGLGILIPSSVGGFYENTNSQGGTFDNAAWNYGVFATTNGNITTTQNNVSPLSFNIGVYGEARNNKNAIGIQGVAFENNNSSAFTSASIGGLFQSTTVTNFRNIGVRIQVQTGSIQNHGIESRIIGTQGQVNAGGIFDVNTSGVVNYGVLASAMGGSTNFAGFFNGDVVCTGGGSMCPSDVNLKTNITSLNNASSLLAKLSPKYFEFNTANYPTINLPSGLQMGLVAQEVDSILPSIVGTGIAPEERDSLGNLLHAAVSFKTIKYQELIPLLIAGFNEQQTKLDSVNTLVATQDSINQNLQTRLAALEVCINKVGICNNHGNNDNNRQGDHRANTQTVTFQNLNAIVLDQNLPNPFAESTQINYVIPTDVLKATLLFYDMNGRIINKVILNDRGNGTLTVYGENLEKGIYTYSLIADGKLIATKKMVKQ